MNADAVRSIVDANAYMTLATADEHGRPWAAPVWYATDDYREFIWASKPEARHSCNIERRAEIAIVIFDSQQAPGTGQGVYLSARAERVPEAELDRCLRVYAARSSKQGVAAWGRSDVEPPARHRLYRAVVTEHFVLGSTDERLRIIVP